MNNSQPHRPLRYCPDLFAYNCRISREVLVGSLGIGGQNPVRIQSMLTSDTRDTEACVREALGLAEVGCELIRLTAQTKIYAANLENIVRKLREAGCTTPLVADIHFKPDAAMEAAKWVEKIRVNPGNFVDKKKFESRDYSDAEYEEEIETVRVEFAPLVEFCKTEGRAMRIGTNHGSLSDRIMNRYGDTPLGMVESALEFAKIARDCDYHQLVFSMKASNPKVMIEAYRLLVARLVDLGADWNYPIHLGVTEAGDGEDGRIKSAIGIGSLLSDGIGDTIRVSLTEDAIHEIPVARRLVELREELRRRQKSQVAHSQQEIPIEDNLAPSYDPFSFDRRKTEPMTIAGIDFGPEQPQRVFVTQRNWDQLQSCRAELGDCQPELVLEAVPAISLDPRDQDAVDAVNSTHEPCLVTVSNQLEIEPIFAFRRLAAVLDSRHSILLKDLLAEQQAGKDCEKSLLLAAQNLGSLLCDGIGDAILVRGEVVPVANVKLAYNILQASGSRIFKTEYISCPSCGRTLFNLQQTTQKIRLSTAHLKGVRIAVMGCIVNGPGEMADADFGYVGGAPGKINLYVGKTPVKFNIPEHEAVDRLIDLIKDHGKWADPATKA